jgi:hypothetical protein
LRWNELTRLMTSGEVMTHVESELLKELEERLWFETLLADISARFVNLLTEQIDGEIKKVPPDKKRGFS